MSLRIYTSRIGDYQGPDSLDISRKSAQGIGLALAPSIELLRQYHPRFGGTAVLDFSLYAQDYLRELTLRTDADPGPIEELIEQDEVTLLCYCPMVASCHRWLAALWLQDSVSALYLGERPGRQLALAGLGHT